MNVQKLPDPSVFDAEIAASYDVPDPVAHLDRHALIRLCIRIGEADYHDLLTKNVDHSPRWTTFVASPAFGHADTITQALCKIAVRTGRYQHHQRMFMRPHPMDL